MFVNKSLGVFCLVVVTQTVEWVTGAGPIRGQCPGHVITLDQSEAGLSDWEWAAGAGVVTAVVT